MIDFYDTTNEILDAIKNTKSLQKYKLATNQTRFTDKIIGSHHQNLLTNTTTNKTIYQHYITVVESTKKS